MSQMRGRARSPAPEVPKGVALPAFEGTRTPLSPARSGTPTLGDGSPTRSLIQAGRGLQRRRRAREKCVPSTGTYLESL
jgi:hypothetical protein